MPDLEMRLYAESLILTLDPFKLRYLTLPEDSQYFLLEETRCILYKEEVCVCVCVCVCV